MSVDTLNASKSAKIGAYAKPSKLSDKKSPLPARGAYKAMQNVPPPSGQAQTIRGRFRRGRPAKTQGKDLSSLGFRYKYRCLYCHEVIFYLKERPVYGQAILAGHVWLKSTMKHPNPGDEIKCPLCREPFVKLYISQVTYL